MCMGIGSFIPPSPPGPCINILKSFYAFRSLLLVSTEIKNFIGAFEKTFFLLNYYSS